MAEKEGQNFTGNVICEGERGLGNAVTKPGVG